MFDDFIIRAFLAGIGIAVITGVMGCFVVWRRMAYFGDSLSHSALLGVVFGFSIGININLATIIISFIFATLLLFLQQKKILATDTLLGILSHFALSAGLIGISLLSQKINILGFLFGDILTVDFNNLLWVYLGGIIVVSLLIINWQKLVLMTIDENLAKVENTNTFLLNWLLMLLMTIVVAISIKIVGVLLITAMLIIPASTSRQFSWSPESMAVISVIFAILSVIFGILFSLQFDIPTSPAIVVVSAFIFFVVLIFSECKRLYKN